MLSRSATIAASVAWLLCATPAFAVTVGIQGFDACETGEYAPTGTGWSVVTTPVTGRCQAGLTLTSGAASYATQTFAATEPAQTRAVITWKPPAAAPYDYGTRTLLATGVATANQDGCRVSLDADAGVLRLNYQSATYEELGNYTIVPNVATSINVLQDDGSGGTCAAGTDCVITCSMWVDGYRRAYGTYTSIKSGDYNLPTRGVIGSRETGVGRYTVSIDDWVSDDNTATPIGMGYVAALNPNADGTKHDWAAGGGAGLCGNSPHLYACVYDWTTGAGVSDLDLSRLLTSTNLDLMDLQLSTFTLGTGETVAAAQAVGLARKTSSGTHTYRLNLTNAGASAVTGSDCVPPDGGSWAWCLGAITPTMPGGGAWVVASLEDQIEKRSTGQIYITATQVYVDVRKPALPLAQNLQDWNGDGRLVIAALGDSVTQGTGLGICQSNASAGFVPADVPGGTTFTGQCSQNLNCLTWDGAITTPCEAKGLTGAYGTCTDYGPCASSGKYPTALAGVIQQTVGTGTTMVLNCGIGGNTLGHLAQRVPDVNAPLLTGVGLVNARHCMTGTGVSCTPDNTTGANKCIGGPNDQVACPSGSSSICPGGYCAAPCGTSKQCPSATCDAVIPLHGNYCTLDCLLASGSMVCSGNHATSCTVNADCSGLGYGTCTDYPPPDYVLPMIGGNDVRIIHNPSCTTLDGQTYLAPCPPMSTVGAGQPTPATTPTPPAYFAQRVRCSSQADCGFGATGGLCSNDFTLACDADGDCAGGGTCNTALGFTGLGSTCSAGTCSGTTTRSCYVDAGCPVGETCNTSAKICTAPCGRIKCTQDSDCQQGVFTAIDGVTTVTGFGKCVSGACSSCGTPGVRFVCSGNTNTSCTSDTGCATYGLGTCTVENGNYLRIQRAVGAQHWKQGALGLKTTLAAGNAHVVWMIYPPANQDINLPDISGWYWARDDLLLTRHMLLNGEIVPNVVDTYLALRRADKMINPIRCTRSPSTKCLTNADCPNSSECALLGSTLRPLRDPIHFNSLGASEAGVVAANYLLQFSPVCSDDPTTPCGRCSVTTTTKCLTSADCPAFTTGEKCLATGSASATACSGKGTCTTERTCYSTTDCTDHSLCVNDLTRKCTSNAGCATATPTPAWTPTATLTSTAAAPTATSLTPTPTPTATPNSCRPEGLTEPGAG